MTKKIPCSFFASLIPLILAGVCEAQFPGVVGDFSNDGAVSNADYSVLGDAWGQNTFLINDPTLAMPIGPPQYAEYVANFGSPNDGSIGEGPPSITISPFTIAASPTVDGDTQWTLRLTGVTSSLAASANIYARDAGGVSRTLWTYERGASFQDVPGVLFESIGNTVRQGVVVPGSTSDVDLFAGLGTTLGRTFQTGAGENLTYLTLVTNGLDATTLTVKGRLGYKGIEYQYQQAASFGGVEIGSSPSNPLLPNIPSPGQFNFSNAPSGRWFDPPLVPGFEYVMESDSLFTGIPEFPPGFAGPFQVAAEGVSLGQFDADQSVDFVGLLGHGVTQFTVSGITPLVDSADTMAFPLRITFSTPFASFKMVAIPEPATMLLASVGFASLLLNVRRTRNPNCRAIRLSLFWARNSVGADHEF